MIQLLSRLFIKDYKNTTDSSVRTAYGVLSGAVGIFLNVLLFIGKFLAGTISGSIAITADAFNNLSDAGSSIITLIGFKMADSKPDPDHPFGHGRIEYLSGLIVSLLILLMSVELIKTSVQKIMHPGEVNSTLLTLAILFVSILVKLYMSYYNHALAKKLHSPAMGATAADSISDSLSTTVVLICTLISRFFDVNIDAYCGVVVGLFILYTGICAARDTINPLLGQSPDPEFVDQIEKIVKSEPQILGIHDLIVHDYGPGRVMISLHAEVPASGNILVLHDIIDNVEHQLIRDLHCHAVIHMDPIQNDDEDTIALKKQVSDILNTIDPIITMHDFRIVEGPTHTNLIFDVVVPFHFSLSSKELTDLIQQKVSELNPAYFTVIDVDRQYSVQNDKH